MEQWHSQLISSPIQNLTSTSTLSKRKFKEIGLQTFWNLINYFPFRYENYSIISALKNLQNGEKVTIKGKIINIINLYSKKGLRMQKATVEDKSGKITAIWYN